MADTYNDPAIDDDRFRYEDRADLVGFREDCIEVDARVRRDVQELLCRAEDMLTAWARDGLLDLSHSVHRYCDETKQFQSRKMLRTRREAVDHYLACLRETLLDARSLTALEAEEVARGEQ